MKRKVAIARLERGGKRFEIYVYPEKAWRLKQGEKIDVREVVEGEFVYYDARKGLKASESDLRAIFGTDDVYRVAEEIIKRGEIQLTAEQRREMIEAKRRQIIEFLSRNAVDPRTNLPHPPKRIELALEEVRVGIDPFRPFEEQLPRIMKELRKVLPLKIAVATVGVRIPPRYVGKAYGVLSKMGKIIRSSYASDGTLIMEIEVPGGVAKSVVEQVTRLTRGEGEARILSVK